MCGMMLRNNAQLKGKRDMSESVENERLCITCKKKPGKPHYDNGLYCGDDMCNECFKKMCNECFKKMCDECRKQSW